MKRLIALLAAILLAVTGITLAAETGQAATGHVPEHHTVTAREVGNGRGGLLVVTDQDLVLPSGLTVPIKEATYALYDGYIKTALFQGNGSPIRAVDINANCGKGPAVNGQPGPLLGDGTSCHPFLHNVEVTYPVSRSLIGRQQPPKVIHVTEPVHPATPADANGTYVTVGHINHGAGLWFEYKTKAGDSIRINLNGKVLITRVIFVRGHGYSAVVHRHN